MAEQIGNTLLSKDLPLDASAPGGMVEFRRALAVCFLFKFTLRVLHLIGQPLEASELSAIQPKQRPLSKGTQVFVDSKYVYEPLYVSL